MICLAVFVAAIVGVAWIALAIDKRNKKKQEQAQGSPHDQWTPPGPSADPKPLEPVNGDPAVLQPEPEPEHQDQPEQPATQAPEDDEPTDQEPTGHDDDKDEDYDGAWNELITLFSQIVPLEGKADTLNYLRYHYDIAYDYFKGTSRDEII